LPVDSRRPSTGGETCADFAGWTVAGRRAASLYFAASAQAARVPSAKVEIVPAHGVRPDITHPYTTNGRSTLGVANGVAPYMYGKNGLSPVNDSQQRGVYNIIYYGSSLGPSADFNWARPRPPNQLRPNR
jgi:hypothetical protein